MNTKGTITATDSFFTQQMACWPETAARFEALHDKCQTRELAGAHSCLKVQYNPARTVSNKAKTDKASIKKRPCFLCAANRPLQQLFLNIRQGYQLLVNPFPILPEHFTLAASEHRPQEILPEFKAFRDFLSLLPQYIVFYNGPQCGASAPDHLHFQAGSKGCVPIEAYWKTDYEPYLSPICPAHPGTSGSSGHYGLFLLNRYPAPAFVFRTHKDIEIAPLFRLVYQALPGNTDNQEEPMLNLIGWQGKDGEQTILLFPRSKHRPEAYFQEGEQHLAISPGAIDMGGLLITVNEEDYNRITPEKAEEILAEVSLNREQVKQIIGKIGQQTHALPNNEPQIQVGILSRPKIVFTLHEPYSCDRLIVSGEQKIECCGNLLLWNGQRYPEILLKPEKRGLFSIPNVTIGIQFHWQKEEQQTFWGGIRLVPDQGKVVLINCIGIEDYLSSVISSEMNADCPFEFLKASAIISRSWILSQIRHKQHTASTGVCGSETEQEIIRWYERSDHRLFDVCADDHCQRYQGIGRITSDRSLQAVAETRGEVLLHDFEICDARFSKCCGGMTEEYATCWENIQVPYLTAHSDQYPSTSGDLHEEDQACQWIESRPDCFCNTDDQELLKQILNNYDQTTGDFFRWEVTYSQQTLAELIKKKSGIDFGQILNLTPIERGPGGHLSRLLITGSRCSRIIGKELEIRRTLSETHLYSSAFHIIRNGKGPVPESFTLRGAGWGHGVGMCQIGAAVMGKQGYDYRQILQHYYPKTEIKKLY